MIATGDASRDPARGTKRVSPIRPSDDEEQPGAGDRVGVAARDRGDDHRRDGEEVRDHRSDQRAVAGTDAARARTARRAAHRRPRRSAHRPDIRPRSRRGVRTRPRTAAAASRKDPRPGTNRSPGSIRNTSPASAEDERGDEPGPRVGVDRVERARPRRPARRSSPACRRTRAASPGAGDGDPVADREGRRRPRAAPTRRRSSPDATDRFTRPAGAASRVRGFPARATPVENTVARERRRAAARFDTPGRTVPTAGLGRPRAAPLQRGQRPRARRTRSRSTASSRCSRCSCSPLRSSASSPPTTTTSRTES